MVIVFFYLLPILIKMIHGVNLLEKIHKLIWNLKCLTIYYYGCCEVFCKVIFGN